MLLTRLRLKARIVAVPTRIRPVGLRPAAGGTIHFLSSFPLI
ncbi:MAG: hypothetical protein ABS932_07045 [Stenotrophomonas sp.]|jgi:hypothetical protein